jgi:uncharacterized protein DUF1707
MDVEHRNPAAIRASDVERDEVLVRLHGAFAEGRLTEVELDERTESALAARTRAELDRLLADLPAVPARPAPTPATSVRPGRLHVAYKDSLRRGGRWRVPDGYTAVVYKGGGLLDLREAELDGPVTRIRAVAYKSAIEIIVPGGVRVEASGFGVSSEVYGDPAPDAPVIQIRGVGYKGRIDAHT